MRKIKLLAYQKLENIVSKYMNMSGFKIPKDVLESNIAREFRFCKEEVRQMLDEIKIKEKYNIIKRKRKNFKYI